MKTQLCQDSSCIYYQRYCRIHRQETVKKRAKIKPVSDKRAKVNRKEYSPEAKQYVKDNPLCKALTPVCLKVSQCVHHLKGKSSIELLLDKRYWLPVCVPCNNWIEANDKEARELNLKLSKFN